MRWAAVIAVAFGALAGIGARITFRSQAEASDPNAPRVAYNPRDVTANGVVEGGGPGVAGRPEVAGTIVAIQFRENQEVKKGDVLVELQSATQKAQVLLARSEVAIAKANLERLINGEPTEKRKAAAAVEAAMRAA